MLTFDKLKIVTSASNISVLRDFDVTTRNGVPVASIFKKTVPCSIAISVYHEKDEASIEFSGKILKDHYDELINQKNIRLCLEAINALGVCNLNVPAILKDSYVVKCDVTKDVEGVDLSDLKNYLLTHVSNNNKWAVDTYQNNNIELRKLVRTPRHRRRLILYDKWAELNKATNRDFLLWAGNGVLEKMKGRIRFELSLTTCHAIREALKIEDTTLMSVMRSKANPIAELLSVAIQQNTSDILHVKKSSDYDKTNTLIVNNWNVKPIEMQYRVMYGKKYHRSKLYPYIRLIEEHKQKEVTSYDFSAICNFNDDYTMDTSEHPHISLDYWSINVSGVPNWEDDSTGMDFVI